MRRHVIIIFAVILFSIIACSSPGLKPIQSPLSGRIICVDPGHGGTAATDDYRVGPSGEREEWINLRVALRLREGLISRGAEVLLTRSEDVDVPLKERARKAVGSKVDAFISIHHNATADREVNFPIIYYHGNASENRASVRMARLVAQHLKETLFSEDHPVSVVSDHVIFPNTGTAILRHSYGIPGIIGEASFFTNPKVERRLKDNAYNKREAQAYFEALKKIFKLKSS